MSAPFRIGQILTSNQLNSLFDTPVVNVLGYAGVDNTGATDSTAGLLAAFAAGAGSTITIPSGTYLISAPILVYPNTTVIGAGAGSVVKFSSSFTNYPGASVPWGLTGAHYRASPVVDKNITVSNLSFDATLQAGAHCIHFEGAQNITTQGCLFTGGGDAVALVKCATTLVQGNAAYGFSNCAYDHWDNPADARVIGNYAESSASAQIVNFNANPTISSSGNTANGCVISGNNLVITGASTCTLNLNPLSSGNLTKNVAVVGNTLSGPISIVGQGNTQNVTVIGNILSGITTNAAIAFFGDGTDFPSNVNIIGNTIINPQTNSGSLGVIQMRCDGFFVGGNTVTGSGFVCALYAVGHVGIVGINNFAAATGTTINAPTSPTANQNIVLANGQSFEWFDSTGAIVRWTLQSDNNHLFYGTDAGGAARLIFGIQQHASASVFHIEPTVQLAHGSANYVQVSGAASGSPPLITSTGSPDTDIALLVEGLGNFGVAIDAYVQSGAPTNTSFPAHHMALWKNTGDSTVKLYYNDAGTLKSVTLS